MDSISYSSNIFPPKRCTNSKIDQYTCYDKSCKNNGTCVLKNHNFSKCACTAPFYGLFCENEKQYQTFKNKWCGGENEIISDIDCK